MYQLNKSYRQEATKTLLTSYLQRLSRMHMYINLTFIAQKDMSVMVKCKLA